MALPLATLNPGGREGLFKSPERPLSFLIGSGHLGLSKQGCVGGEAADTVKF